MTTTAGEGGFASFEYVTVRSFGRFLQILELESEGSDARAITANQIARADQLTVSLSDRWQSAFG